MKRVRLDSWAGRREEGEESTQQSEVLMVDEK